MCIIFNVLYMDMTMPVHSITRLLCYFVPSLFLSVWLTHINTLKGLSVFRSFSLICIKTLLCTHDKSRRFLIFSNIIIHLNEVKRSTWNHIYQILSFFCLNCISFCETEHFFLLRSLLGGLFSCMSMDGLTFIYGISAHQRRRNDNISCYIFFLIFCLTLKKN